MCVCRWSQGSVGALHINPDEFCRSGRAWATALLFPRAAAVQPTLEYCFLICFSTCFCSLAQFWKQHPIVILSSTTTETGKAFNTETCTESESSQHFCAIHLPHLPLLRSGLFCSCKINPPARNSLPKKHPLNFQLNFSPIRSARPPHSASRAGSNPPSAASPRQPQRAQPWKRGGWGHSAALHLWKYFKIAKTRGGGSKKGNIESHCHLCQTALKTDGAEIMVLSALLGLSGTRLRVYLLLCLYNRIKIGHISNAYVSKLRVQNCACTSQWD